MSKSDRVKNWRKRLKLKCVDLFGGKCNICNYDRCVTALEFHHLDPKGKDFGIGSITANPKKWDEIIEELKKCIMVCANCHREIHYGLIEVEEKIYIDREALKYNDKCVCGEVKLGNTRYCSRSCAGKYSYGRKMVSYEDVKKMFYMRDVENMSWEKISEKLEFSKSCLQEHYRKDVGGLKIISDKNIYRGLDLKKEIKDRTNVDIALELGVSEAAVRKAIISRCLSR